MALIVCTRIQKVNFSGSLASTDTGIRPNMTDGLTVSINGGVITAVILFLAGRG